MHLVQWDKYIVAMCPYDIYFSPLFYETNVKLFRNFRLQLSTDGWDVYMNKHIQ